MRLIDADALIEFCAERWIPLNIDAVNMQPTIQSEPKWIPCSERLPDDLAEVNVTWVNHEPELYYESIKSKPFYGVSGLLRR